MARAAARHKARAGAAGGTACCTRTGPIASSRVTLALATLAVLLSLAVALASVAAWRSASADAARLREQARELSERLQAAERTAGQAAAQAEIASQLLVDKGIADEDDLEAIRGVAEAPEPGAEEPPATRGGRTVH